MNDKILRKLADTLTFEKVYGNLDYVEENLRKFILNNIDNLYLAGGSVRDTLLGVEVKDYDLFIDVSKVNYEGLKASGYYSVLHCLTTKVETQEEYDLLQEVLEEYPEGACMNQAKGLVDIYKLPENLCKEGVRLTEIILCQGDPIERIKTFPVHISEAYIKLSEPNKVLYTEGFAKDFINKTITVNKACVITCEDRFNSYVERIISKYPKRKVKGFKKK